jgi:hypothetical protein
VPRTGAALTARTAFCEDGDVQPRPQEVRTIPGVDVHDEVVRTDAWQLMLADRRWSVPRDQLPASVRPYVGH